MADGNGERPNAEVTVYESVGGMPFFEQLVGLFYDHVEADPVLLSLYPEPDDLGPARERLTLFLAQYWGGPTTYSDERGHPRLRMRHQPFVIGADERDHWLAAMRASLDELDPAPALRFRFDSYFDMAADSMRNADA
jgi:hemoglobin